MTRDEHQRLLKKWFGFPSFKDWQWGIISRILNGERIVSIESTGAGKSLCFQYPAQYFYEKGMGTTIIISPLQALMRDHVIKLQGLGIKADLIISDKKDPTKDERLEIEAQHRSVLEKACKNEITILYISPERLENPIWKEYFPQIKIALLCVDEAHCISEWGHDFRKSYQNILSYVRTLPLSVPILAVTATANQRVADDISFQLGSFCKVIRGKMERENLFLSIHHVRDEKERMLQVLQFVRTRNGNGIIYTGTRADAENYSHWLNSAGINSAYYHADLDSPRRRELELDLKYGKYKVLVSTCALGMGIDIPDIRFIVHIQITKTLLSYYQEIGRAGRDGKPSDILLLYKSGDEKLPLDRINNSLPREEHYKMVISVLKDNASIKLRSLAEQLNIKESIVRNSLEDLCRYRIAKRNEKNEYIFLSDKSLEPIIEHNKDVHDAQLMDFDYVMDYIDGDKCHTAALSDYLGAVGEAVDGCTHCNYCASDKFVYSPNIQDMDLLNAYLNETRLHYVIKAKRNEIEIAISAYYSEENIQANFRISKYGKVRQYYPESFVDKLEHAYRKYFSDKHIDYISFIPPSSSGDLVENLAFRFASKVNLEVTYDLHKNSTNEDIKNVVSRSKKKKILAEVLDVQNGFKYVGKNILIIDDIIDSGSTIEVAALKYLEAGASKIYALAVAKTKVGDA